jgi:hypothetical protein
VLNEVPILENAMKAAIAMLALACTPALSETTYMVRVSNPVTKVQPSAQVQVWAVFDDDLFAFAAAAFDFLADSDAGGFSDPHRLLSGPGTQDGEVSEDGDAVTGIVSGQLHCPIEFCNDTSNPILIWEATWSTDDFSRRIVGLRSDTEKFDVYIDADGTSMSFTDELVEGMGAIDVGCYADMTFDGTLDLYDFLYFLNVFNAEDPRTDCTGDGAFDLFDFLCFVNAFNEGC